jgi:competence protein ComEA
VTVAAEGLSSTFSEDETTTIVTGPMEEQLPAEVSAVETEQQSRPVASSFDSPIETDLPRADADSLWGLSARDQLVLMVLTLVCLVFSIWHWGQLSGWGIEPVEIDRQPERVYDYRIDLNQATWMELIQLPGVGQALAERIIQYRDDHGPFQSVEELDDVSGIGPKTIEKLRPWLIIDEEESHVAPQTSLVKE